MNTERLSLDDFDDYTYEKQFRPGRVVLEIEGSEGVFLVQSGGRTFTTESQGVDAASASTVCHIESYGPLGFMGIELERFKLNRSFLLGKLPGDEEVLLPLSEIR